MIWVGAWKGRKSVGGDYRGEEVELNGEGLSAWTFQNIFFFKSGRSPFLQLKQADTFQRISLLFLFPYTSNSIIQSIYNSPAMRSADICQAMLKFSLKFPQNHHYQPLKLQHFTDGIPFAHMLITSDTISLSITELQQNSGKWITKVSNLKKILTKIHNFLELVNEKTERIKDIDVVQIAKNISAEHIAKFFEVVVSVLMNSAEKEKYIQLIMTLDEHSQNTFVEIIQNSLDQQIFPSQQGSNFFQMQEELTQLRRENASLKVELNDVMKKYKGLQRDVNELREKVLNYEYQEERGKGSEFSNNSQGLLSQLQQQRALIDNLKLKLLSTVRENQIELSQLREEVSLLQLKTKNMEELESTLEQYKEMYNQNLNDQQRLIQLEKDKRRLTRQIEEKEQIIKKLQGKIETTIEKNYSMQENQLYMKLELEKREVRFKQLEKEVKIRLKSQPSELTPRIADIDPHQEEKEELLYLQDQLNKSKISLKELEKESIKNRKKLQRMGQLELEKKKLEKIIVEVNRSKDMEIELLVVSLYQLRNENIKIFEMLKSVTDSRMGDKRT